MRNYRNESILTGQNMDRVDQWVVVGRVVMRYLLEDALRLFYGLFRFASRGSTWRSPSRTHRVSLAMAKVTSVMPSAPGRPRLS